ncbi:HlyD family efflux transporter periplasmic adaptor subunit [Shimia isoporae]|nr:HlyD family efflux transporter periplasmic adaptor subunit [Shimia isoporae]
MGHLNAPLPNFDIQHPVGGDIQEVLIKEHEPVVAGQVLVRMDVTNERAQHAELEGSLQSLIAERAAIQWALSFTPTAVQTPYSGLKEELSTAAQSTAQNSSHMARISNMLGALRLHKDVMTQTADAMLVRAQGLEHGLQARLQQRRSMQARFDKFRQLVATGAFRASDNDTLLEAILDLDSSIRSQEAEVAAIKLQAAQTELQIHSEELELRQKLLDRQSQIATTIPRLRMRLLRLEAVLQHAELRAPANGTIAQLHYDTEAMYVPRGETVLTLTRHTKAHHVAFVVPPHAIDQVRVGMAGKLKVSSLPQRNHPEIRVEIASISPEAQRDAEETVLGYDGIAQINRADLQNLRKQMGDELSLSIDMPVTLIFTGRQTTFADYLIGPFWDFLAKALQD